MNARLLKILAFATGLGLTPVASADLDFPAPRGAKVVVVGEGMVLNGVTMSSWELTSTERPSAVLDFYRAAWAEGEDGQPGFTEMPLGEWTLLTRVDESEGKVYTVQVQPGAVGGSYALLGVSNLLETEPTPAVRLGADIPKMAGSTVQNDLVAEDLGVRSRTVMLDNAHSVKQNVDFYLEHFERDGWAIETGTLIDDHGTGAIMASSGNRRWNMTFVPRDRRTWVVAVLEQR
jgi:hypothetical protein